MRRSRGETSETVQREPRASARAGSRCFEARATFKAPRGLKFAAHRTSRKQRTPSLTRYNGRGVFCTLLALITAGCASHRPGTNEPFRPAVFHSTEGRVTVTVHSDLRREPARPTSRKRLEWFLYGPDDEPANILRRPQGLSIAGGFLYIADQGLPDVLRYDLASRTFSRWIGAGDRPTCPIAAVADDSDHVYIADAARRVVSVFNERGHRQMDLAMDADGSGLSRPSALLVNSDTLYIADSEAHLVRRWNTSRKVWMTPLGPGEDGSKLAMPVGLAMTPQGELLVTDAMLGVIHRFGADGIQISPIGEYGGEAGQLIRPIGIACTPSGIIVVADAGRESVMLFDSQGNFILEIGGPKKSWSGFVIPAGVAVLPALGQPASTDSTADPSALPIPEWVAVSDTMRGALTLMSIKSASPR